MVNVRRQPRGTHPAGHRNSADTEDDVLRYTKDDVRRQPRGTHPAGHRNSVSATEELLTKHIDIDGLRYTKDDLRRVVEILRTSNAWLDDTCIQIQMMRLKTEHQIVSKESVELVFVIP
jgi:hypothetical protein